MDPTPFTDDWKEFLRLANLNRLRYLVVGGVAMVLHGLVRATADIDIWIDNRPANIRKLKTVLTEFGFNMLADKLPKQFSSRQALFLGKPPYRIDVLSGISGTLFSQAYRAKVIIKIHDLTIPVVGLNELMQNKKAAGRLKDKADVELIKQLRQQRSNKGFRERP
ncbi:MAG: hypothetical protein JNJ77_03995 [Planctomycetia bacterium]|nr:hypothetical protein [Planctomycetia bacterium]